MPNIRLPLLNSAEFRSSSSTSKDSITVNGFIEEESKELFYVYKRAGRILKTSGTGSGNGCYYYNGKLYQWDSGTSNTSPTITVM